MCLLLRLNKCVHVAVLAFFCYTLYFISCSLHDAIISKDFGLSLRFLGFNSKNLDAASVEYSRVSFAKGVYSVTLEDGDTLEQVFNDINLSQQQATLIARAINKVYSLKNLKVGELVEFSFLSGDEEKVSHKGEDFTAMNIEFANAKVHVTLNNDGYEAERIPYMSETRRFFAEGQVTSTFFEAAHKQGLSNRLTLNLINVLSSHIDFQKDLANGNTFKIVYEFEVNEKGRKVREESILYAYIAGKNKNVEIYGYQNKNGKIDYYDKNGISVKKQLLKTPIRSATVSSGFGMRMHPILGYSRMHRGLDYAASKGTPIIAAGDGFVEVIRYHNSYGRYVKIKHNKHYTTLYAHMDSFAKIKHGQKVVQGQVIGYVGSSGTSTGNHLHYEVIVDGKQVNPAKFTMTTDTVKLSNDELKLFKNQQASIQDVMKQKPNNIISKS